MTRWTKMVGRAAAPLMALITVLGLSACASTVSTPPVHDYSSSIASGADGTKSDTPSADPFVVKTDHVGQTSEQASAELTQQGLLVAFADASGQPLPQAGGWWVVEQQPAAGAAVPPGTVVRLVVTPPVITTDHVGQSSEQASGELTGQGLLVSYSDAAGSAVGASAGWSVIGQNPAAGTTLHAGSTVQLIVSPPPPPPARNVAPPPAQDPSGGATALCNDGTLSYSAHHQGTCSHHGGVAVWYK